MKFLRIALCAVFILGPVSAKAEEKNAKTPIKIYLESDRTHHTESAVSIERGVKVALEEIGYKIDGKKIEVVLLDHRGNTVRSKLNMQKYLKDQNALVIYGGLHSPPLIKNRKFINENEILYLVPWAAGGPITRYPSKENWIFRLSIDDTKAGYKLVEFALDNRECKAPHLFMENTPWGESNIKTATKALKEKGITPTGVTRFGWNIGQNEARSHLHKAINKDHGDCLIFVGNAIDAISVFNALLSMKTPRKIPVISHWGITGGNFHKVLDAEKRKNLDLHFIQTCFSFLQKPKTEFSTNVFQKAQTLFPDDIKNEADITAPPGFIHGYDLTRLMLEALKKIKLSGNIKNDRRALRSALENIQGPVEGLVKTYRKPFGVFTVENDDAHEALGLDDFCMAGYDNKNKIHVLPKK